MRNIFERTLLKKIGIGIDIGRREPNVLPKFMLQYRDKYGVMLPESMKGLEALRQFASEDRVNSTHWQHGPTTMTRTTER